MRYGCFGSLMSVGSSDQAWLNRLPEAGRRKVRLEGPCRELRGQPALRLPDFTALRCRTGIRGAARWHQFTLLADRWKSKPASNSSVATQNTNKMESNEPQLGLKPLKLKSLLQRSHFFKMSPCGLKTTTSLKQLLWMSATAKDDTAGPAALLTLTGRSATSILPNGSASNLVDDICLLGSVRPTLSPSNLALPSSRR